MNQLRNEWKIYEKMFLNAVTTLWNHSLKDFPIKLNFKHPQISSAQASIWHRSSQIRATNRWFRSDSIPFISSYPPNRIIQGVQSARKTLFSSLNCNYFFLSIRAQENPRVEGLLCMSMLIFPWNNKQLRASRAGGVNITRLSLCWSSRNEGIGGNCFGARLRHRLRLTNRNDLKNKPTAWRA